MNEQVKIAHLGFIQGIITRMGTNSFLLKGWSITLVAAIFALSSRNSNGKFVLIAYFPVFVFWWLDAFYLNKERLYRKLYEDVAKDTVKSDQFTLDTNLVKSKVPTIFEEAFSKTIAPFYSIVVGVILLAMYCLLNA